LTLAVVTTFHTALAKTADAQTKVPMMPDDAGDAQAFFFWKVNIFVVVMNFPAIICNNLQSCYCLLLCFFLFLAQIWRSVWFWGFFWARG